MLHVEERTGPDVDPHETQMRTHTHIWTARCDVRMCVCLCCRADARVQFLVNPHGAGELREGSLDLISHRLERLL